MILQALLDGNTSILRRELPAFLSEIRTKRRFDWSVGDRELPTGAPSHFLDLFPADVVTKHESFGSLFVRVWAVGHTPTKLIYGLFLGAERAQQAEPRRAAAHVRERLQSLIDPLERERRFHYKHWGDSDIWWQSEGQSVRAVTRQFEQFVTSRTVELTSESEPIVLEDIALLVQASDTAVDLLSPIRQFGMDVIELYYGTNLPAAPLRQGQSDAVETSQSEETTRETGGAIEAPQSFDLGQLRGLEQQFSQVVAALRAGKHVILLGPPGAGKTSLAEVVCRELSRPYDLATATSDWSTFETIGGYLPRPQEGGTSGPSEPLDFTPGIVIQAIEARRWLVIDELNRADIDKAFGELFTLFGGTDPSIRLPYQKRQSDGSYLQVALGRASSSAGDQHVYPLPADWRLIATMNTFDKASLYQLSFAFMRRFAFIEVPIPAPTDYQAIIATAGAELASLDEQLRTSTVSALSSLFTSVGPETLNGLGLTIGPAIPLDVISYLTNRWTEDASAPDLVLEALEMFLFPQFEGQAEKHSEIAQAIANALGHSSLPDTSEQRLRTWTGFIP